MLQPGQHRVALVATCALIAIAITALRIPEARADRVAELSKDLSSSSSDKTRLAAVTALARLGDKTALKPLVGALADPNAQVRVIAAVALGKLGHKAALPALRNAARDDTDATVRANARAATLAVAKANKLPDGLTPEPVVASAWASTPSACAESCRVSARLTITRRPCVNSSLSVRSRSSQAGPSSRSPLGRSTTPSPHGCHVMIAPPDAAGPCRPTAGFLPTSYLLRGAVGN